MKRFMLVLILSLSVFSGCVDNGPHVDVKPAPYGQRVAEVLYGRA